ncbi:MAG: hypothetical protein K9L32_01405 [Chromatiaceae bacterium]|nr:hypothetical protein [Chromatiaceae bacterium]MCF8002862.1 hypothetical protein [Chromatiaceae bacterium]
MAKGLTPKHYRRPEGVIAIPRVVVNSHEFKALSLAARALVVELQAIWKPGTKSLHFSARRAGDLLGTSKTGGARALNELVETQFLVITDESNWQNGLARSYRLTWQPADGLLREPTDDWRQGRLATARPTSHQRDGPTLNRSTRGTVPTKPTSNRSTHGTVPTKHQ